MADKTKGTGKDKGAAPAEKKVGVTLESLAADFGKYKTATDKQISKLTSSNESLHKTNKVLGELLKKKVEDAIVANKESAEIKINQKPKKLVTPTQPVEIDGEEYLFTTSKVRDMSNQIVLTEAIAESPDQYMDLLKHLVKVRSGFLRKKAK